VSDVESPFAFHGQTTYIWQRKPSFGAGYSGENSLTPDRAKSYSFTATLDLGLRLWQGAEFHFNPEVAQGVPFSPAWRGWPFQWRTGQDGQHQEVLSARAFIRQTWGLGGGEEKLEADFNQFARTVDKQRVVLTAGNFERARCFDQNPYGSDPRTQFMNWSFLTHGSFDYAADARGYNWGASRVHRRWLVGAFRPFPAAARIQWPGARHAHVRALRRRAGTRKRCDRWPPWPGPAAAVA
jgi:hypothetical protein